MRPFTHIVAVAAPMLRDNIDTDAIIPSREITTVSKSGLAPGLFAGWRYTMIGGRSPDPGFVLNNPAFSGAKILLTGENFGCGSSREHAVWALEEFGFKVLIAGSFNPIFFRNCVRNGVLPAVLARAAIAQIVANVSLDPQNNRVAVDLAAQTVRAADGSEWPFTLQADTKEMLLHGMDAIDQTLKLRQEIDAFRSVDRQKRPWIYGVDRG